MVENIVILTGAGISAESGLGTFRDADGLWTKYPLEDVATPQGFARNPELVHEFYNARRQNSAEAKPNAAHFALARLEQEFSGSLLIVTQNVDDLHERAGSRNIWHMHGDLSKAKCHICDHHFEAPPNIYAETPCPSCTKPAIRPDIVWFGEMPHFMDEISERLASADLFVSIGTSGNVYPAAGFVQEARRSGAQTLELNLEPSAGANDFHDSRNGPATAIVPDWVNSLL